MGVRISLPVQTNLKFEIRDLKFGIQLSITNVKLQTSNSYMNKVSYYFQESYKELMEKVTWPTWIQLQQSTMIVLASTLLITAIVWIMDFVAAGALNFIYKFF